MDREISNEELLEKMSMLVDVSLENIKGQVEHDERIKKSNEKVHEDLETVVEILKNGGNNDSVKKNALYNVATILVPILIGGLATYHALNDTMTKSVERLKVLESRIDKIEEKNINFISLKDLNIILEKHKLELEKEDLEKDKELTKTINKIRTRIKEIDNHYSDKVLKNNKDHRRYDKALKGLGK
jgi:hypothetical protein